MRLSKVGGLPHRILDGCECGVDLAPADLRERQCDQDLHLPCGICWSLAECAPQQRLRLGETFVENRYEAEQAKCVCSQRARDRLVDGLLQQCLRSRRVTGGKVIVRQLNSPRRRITAEADRQLDAARRPPRAPHAYAPVRRLRRVFAASPDRRASRPAHDAGPSARDHRTTSARRLCVSRRRAGVAEQ